MIEQSSWVVQTKFLVPQRHPDIIERPRLVDVLVEAVQKHPLTLLSAPAGSGKTTLMAALPFALPQMPLGWLALDEDDNQPSRFLAALIGVFRQIHPNCGSKAYSLLETLSDPLVEARQVLGTLINEVLEWVQFPFIIALDDLHVISQPYCHGLLNYLLERQPPQMRLVITTRYDPPLILPKLRARRQVAELRLAQLRFTLEETQQFLTQTGQSASNLDYSQLLQEYTEGWASGLCLLASSLENRLSDTDRDTFIQNLSTTDHYLFDFLAQEVLNQLDADSHTFLLRTSILAELTPALCEAVTLQPNSQQILEQLYRNNLFVIALKGTAQTYRYHDFFREFLVKQLLREVPEEEIRELHLRAGQAERSLERSLRHFLAGQHWPEVTAFMERYGEQYLDQGAYQQLHEWIGLIPQEVVRETSRLLYLAGMCEYFLHNLHKALPLFEAARQAFRANGDREAEGETMVFLVNCLGRATRFAEAQQMSQEALTYPLPPHRKAQLLVGSSYQAIFRGQVEQANRELQEAFELAAASKDRQTISIIALDMMIIHIYLPGVISRLESFLGLLNELLVENSSPLLSIQYHKIRALCLLGRGQYPEAYAEAEKAIKGAEELGGLIFGRISNNVGMILGVCAAWLGDEVSSSYWFKKVLNEIESRAGMVLFQAWWPAYLLYLGRVRCEQNRLSETEQIYRRLLEVPSGGEWPHLIACQLLLDGLLALYRGNLDKAADNFTQVIAVQEKFPYSRILGDAQYLVAYIELQRNQVDRAAARLESVLLTQAKAGAENLILWEGPDLARPLLELAVSKGGQMAEIARPILGRLGSVTLASLPAAIVTPTPVTATQTGSDTPQPLSVPATGETLTTREVEVLHLMATGANNTAIAEQLVISLHTVKIHVSRILAKLEATSRTEAVIRAQEYGLI